MFEYIILLAPVDIFEQICQVLRLHNPSVSLVSVASLDDLVALGPSSLSRSRLISFTNPVIVPKAILDAVGYGAYNFHPGPPSYPGLAPASFAIYQDARFFGATAHAMDEKVDSGPIVACELFLIPRGASVIEIEIQSFGLLARMFRKLAPHLATDPRPLPTLPVTWSPVKSSRRKLAELCDIPLHISADELDRRVRAFGGTHFGIEPTITLHGHTFRLVRDERQPIVETTADGIRVTFPEQVASSAEPRLASVG